MNIIWRTKVESKIYIYIGTTEKIRTRKVKKGNYYKKVGT